ncbi:MAG: VWA domain-containing protein [Sandaracinaceae bacterium]|nr:VWA domain-containing protein [Sandaracinaceae bacterium]
MSRWIALGLRALAVTVVVVAPWAPPIPVGDDGSTVVFVLDRSESVAAEDRELADAFVREAEALDEDARVGVVEVDGAARVRRWPFPRARGEEPVATAGSDLAGGLRLATAILPPSGRRRIVVLTDGRGTTPGAEAAARAAHERGIRVDTFALGDALGGAPRLTSFEAVEDRIAPGEPFEAHATLRGPATQTANVEFSRDGVPVARAVASFDPDGAAEVDLRDPAPPAGVHVYEARVGEQVARRFVSVSSEPRVLLVTLTDRERPTLLMQALEGAGEVGRHALTSGPVSREQLRDVDLVVLADLPLEQPGTSTNVVSGLDLETQRHLLDYVAEDGGGVLVSGGAFGFGPEWAEQPITRMLPVTIEDHGELQDPPVAIAMVLDTSGSMGVEVGGYTKIRLAAEGCLAAASTLRPEDRIAVAAVEERTRWIQPLALVSDLDENRVRRLRAGSGGIFVYTGLRDAYAVLDRAQEPIRHVLLFSDTADSEEQAVGCIWPPCSSQGHTAIELATDARARGITTTVVGIGAADARHAFFLSELAAAGGGRNYITETGADLRRIFVAETRAVSRSNLREEVTPIEAFDHPMLDGVTDIPSLAGFVQARRRATAHTVLTTTEDRPILATWRYGVGTVVAFTSDLSGRWSGGWSSWEQSPQLLRQMVRHAMRRRSARADLDVRLGARGVDVLVDVAPGTEIDPSGLEITAVDERAQTRRLDAVLERVGPERYRARARTEGEPIVVARLRDPEGHVLAEASAEDDSVAEHAGAGADARALRELSRLGGGATVASADELVRAPVVASPDEQPSWPWLFLLVGLLVVIDLWVRRLGRPTRRVVLEALVVAPRRAAAEPDPSLEEAA